MNAMLMSVLTLVFPAAVPVLLKRPGTALLCLILQASIIAWPLAAAIAYIIQDDSDKNWDSDLDRLSF